MITKVFQTNQFSYQRDSYVEGKCPGCGKFGLLLLSENRTKHRKIFKDKKSGFNHKKSVYCHWSKENESTPSIESPTS